MNKIWKILILLVILSLGVKNNSSFGDSNIPESNIAAVTPIEPNLPPEETKIIKKEDRIRKKIETDEAKDALIVKRLQKDIQKMSDAIELDNQRLENLPWPYRHPYHWSGRREELAARLEIAKERWQLLDNQEKNYKNIINLVDRYRVPGVDITDIKKTQAEKYRILGIDIISEKKELIDCQGQKRDMELAADFLRQKIEQIDNDYPKSKRKK